MHQQIRKYSAVFLLLLFLFPIVEKQLHILDHANDAHCVASDKHFHQQEHSCSICDYTLTGSFPVSPFEFIIRVPEYFISFQLCLDSFRIRKSFQDIPSRGPPAC